MCNEAGYRCLAPRLFLAEVAGVLVRFLSPSIVRGVVEGLRDEVTLVGDDLYFTEAVEIALTTGSRGADSYYIGLAKSLGHVLPRFAVSIIDTFYAKILAADKYATSSLEA